MRILLLTQWFQPEPALKGQPFAEALVKRGHAVQVLTGFPNYPSGRLYPGYKLRAYKTETINGIRIVRTFLYPSHSNNKFGRVLNYLSFALSATFFGLLFLNRPDIIYVYHPPATIMFPAIILKLIYRVPVVLDIQDMWPDTLKSTDIINSHVLLDLIGFACRIFYKLVDRIVVLSPGFRDLLKKRGVPENKVKVIYNWCDEASILDTTKRTELDRRETSQYFRVVYAGNIGKAQALETVIRAAQIIQQKYSAIRITLIGNGTEKNELIALAKELNVNNVEFIPFVLPTKIGRYLSEADALLVHLKKDLLFSITIPSKTQAYMAMGKPIIMAVSGDAADLIKKANAGICIEPQNPKALAEAILSLSKCSRDNLRKIGFSGRDFYLNELSINVGVNRFVELFYELT